MSTWQALKRALDEIAERGQAIRIWWRDDDAGHHHPALERLLDLAETHGLPVALAVVPNWLDDATQARVAASSAAVVIQHGFDHANHAAAGAKTIELGGRDPALVMAELASGRALLVERFGATFIAVIAPPWNRIDPAVTERLGGAGFVGLSTFGPRATARVAGILQINTHLDPIGWHSGRRFIGEGPALDQLMAQLEGDEPIGVLSHHLDLDEAGWAFLEQLVTVLAAHPGASFCHPTDLFEARP